MNVFVIGGTRFMGPHVIRILHAQGHRVMVYHRGESRTRLPEGVEHIHADRSRIGEHVSEIGRFAPDVVLDMILLTEAEAVRTVNALSGRTDRYVVVSSVDVYRNMDLLRMKDEGPVVAGRLTEDSPLRRNYYPYRADVRDKSDRMYDYDKILVERVVTGQDRLSWTVLRLPMVYGPSDRQHRLFDYLKRMDDRRPFILLDERQVRARWIRGYVENVAQGIVLAVTDDRATGRVYNVGEPEALTERDWIKAIGRAAGWNGEIVGVPEEHLPRHLKQPLDYRHHLDADSSRIRQELGYTEPIDRAEALCRTVEWERVSPPDAIKEEDFDYRAEDAAYLMSRMG
ncbi:MAG: NAD-dependent epimerase/dehydratase family protein [candidate division Zixibacteria bacterium]|jgi:nucleoside-diphosphate-sugar epimerase|nr:NAD-dependent epimerase/dehydratase family protein [candidate division Zixibacteria bacterium]